jgi:hypothetical protein
MRSMPFRVAVGLVIVAAASGWWYARRTNAASGRANSSQDGLNCVSTVPKNWGVYRGGSEQSGLAFEAADGTLRFVTNLPCDGSTPYVALEIRRTVAPANQ